MKSFNRTLKKYWWLVPTIAGLLWSAVAWKFEIEHRVGTQEYWNRYFHPVPK